MLIESLGHRFRQDTVGMAWSWDLKTYSLTCLLIDGGYYWDLN